MLKTERILLRAIEEKDLNLMAQWRSNPDVYEYFYEYCPISLKQQTIWYDNQLKNPNEMNFVISAHDGNAIGTVSIYNIDRRNRKAEWGRLIIGDASKRDAGIGFDAVKLIQEYSFAHLNLHKLYCDALSSNDRAKALYVKLGFREDCVLREHVFKNGSYVDIVVFSMLDAEYFSTI